MSARTNVDVRRPNHHLPEYSKHPQQRLAHRTPPLPHAPPGGRLALSSGSARTPPGASYPALIDLGERLSTA
jgi:hypothetical protein